jgi:hypothetical protein
LRFHISCIFCHSKNIAIISEFTVYTCSTFLCWHNVVVCFALALRSPLFLFISLAVHWHLTTKKFLYYFEKGVPNSEIFAYLEGKFNLWNSKTRQMYKIQLVQHITVSNTLLCLAIHCLKNNTVSTLALNTVNSEIIAFIYYCDLRKFSQIAIFIIAKHEVLQYKWILMIPKCEV